MLASVPRVYPLLGFCAGYALVMFYNPVHLALRDGLRCLGRYKRVWITFVAMGVAYAIFEFSTFTPIQSTADLDLSQIASVPVWQWPRLAEVWTQAALPALEGVAGLFDNALVTFPLSAIAAVLFFSNWRGVHGALWRALRKRYPWLGFLVYVIVLCSALASLLKPIVYWRLPAAGLVDPRALQISATIDAVAFIFEYLFGIYVQVYLITVCLVWIRGLSFEEGHLFRFAVRRFSYVLEWAGFVVFLSMIFLRLPLWLAYFMRVPDVLDYLPVQRVVMCLVILLFASVQVSLALHNETLRAAFHAHVEFVRKNAGRFGWFLLICAFHFFFLMACNVMVRSAINDRLFALFLWQILFFCLRGVVTGWLLASWVCLFRQCETGRVAQESWIQY